MERINRDNYRQHPAINQSLLKALANHPEKVLEDDKDWSDGLEFGDALDIILFTPDEFNEKYYVTDMDNLPQDNVKDIMQIVVANMKEGDNGYMDKDVLKAAAQVGYGQSWKPETLLRKVLNEYNGHEYARQLIESKGKKTLSIERHMQITHAVETLKRHEFTSRFVSDKLPEHMERLVQVPLMAPSHKQPVWYKGLLDLMLVNHEHKVIYPWDLKSTGTNVLYFPSQIMKFRYDLQAALYTYILETIISECEEGGQPEDYGGLTFNPSGYTVADFGFIVIGSKDTNKPMRYRCTPKDLEGGLYGGTSSQGYDYKGAFQLTEELLWHRSSGKWGYPKEVYDMDGELLVDVY